MFIAHHAEICFLAPQERNKFEAKLGFAPLELRSCYIVCFYKHLVPLGPKEVVQVELLTLEFFKGFQQ